MIEYLLLNCLNLFVRLSLPILIGIGVGGAISIFVQLMLHVEDKAVSFIFRYAGGLVGVYFGLSSISNTLNQYAIRLWSGLDLYK
jgi:hypothetical protein